MSHVVDSGWGYTFNLILVSFYFFHCFLVKSQKIFPSSFPSSLVSITQVSPLCLTLSIFYLLRILRGSFWESTELGQQLGSSPVPQKPRLHHCLVFCPLLPADPADDPFHRRADVARSAPQAARAEVSAEGVLWGLWAAPQAPPPPAQQAPHAPASPWQAGEVPRVLWEAQAQGWVEVTALGSTSHSSHTSTPREQT